MKLADIKPRVVLLLSAGEPYKASVDVWASKKEEARNLLRTGLTKVEIARRMNISRQRVGYLLKGES